MVHIRAGKHHIAAEPAVGAKTHVCLPCQGVREGEPSCRTGGKQRPGVEREPRGQKWRGFDLGKRL